MEKDGGRDWRIDWPPVLWMGRVDAVKMTILPKGMDRFSAVPSKIPMAFFQRQKKKKSQTPMEPQKKSQVLKETLKQKNNAGRISMPDFKLCRRGVVIETAWSWHKDTNKEARCKREYMWL